MAKEKDGDTLEGRAKILTNAVEEALASVKKHNSFNIQIAKVTAGLEETKSGWIVPKIEVELNPIMRD